MFDSIRTLILYGSPLVAVIGCYQWWLTNKKFKTWKIASFTYEEAVQYYLENSKVKESKHFYQYVALCAFILKETGECDYKEILNAVE